MALIFTSRCVFIHLLVRSECLTLPGNIFPRIITILSLPGIREGGSRMGSQENQIKRRSKRRVKEGRERERERERGGGKERRGRKERKKGEEERRGRKEGKKGDSGADVAGQQHVPTESGLTSITTFIIQGCRARARCHLATPGRNCHQKSPSEHPRASQSIPKAT